MPVADPIRARPPRGIRTRRSGRGIGLLSGSCAALALGAVVGILTSLLQADLDQPWLALVNSASPWVAAAMLVGAAVRHRSTALVAGSLTCLAELVGYDGTAHVRGFAAGTGDVVLFAVCAVSAGPLFGVGGWLWRHGAPDSRRSAGPTLLAAAFLAEGIVGYAARLHYWSSAGLLAAIGVTALAVPAAVRDHPAAAVRWFVLWAALAVAAELALDAVSVAGLA